MPKFSQISIRAALLYLVIGGSVGGILLVSKAFGVWPWIWYWRTAHIHAMLVGWLLNLIFGVAFWILPRLDANGWRGSPWLVWSASGLLHIALAVLIWASIWPWSAAIFIASGLECAAAIAMAWHCWPRLQPLIIEPILHQKLK
ncbi:MAG TPA: hypothetical protein DEF47_10095 [Herpetosiphon sp.]|uniref:Uncharacterized protein n=1 Tax=Herpetosiphon aurantiacus (strain ATCC 23779 / DSM 785 / 114-95) TaxID=316274 RepID=A9B1Q6_HERA2|nr:hypothetical protein [Herpetosiphon sp.]ABX03941.1 conserved hypothetical protein [Herpetosiphon aurantiacus DSM 785]HBW50244.1 hypothetical protein [Herpetosiphon sp.]